MISRIATFNIRYGTAPDGPNHWNKRKASLIETIKDLDPDIMGVQECLPFQADEIQMSCPHLAHFGLGRYHGIPVDRDHETWSGEHCSIFYRPDKFLLEDCGTFWHSDTPETPGSISWGNDLTRNATWGRFASKEEDSKVFFCNTHFHWDEPYVTKAADLMASRVAELSDGTPTVLVGDFNASPGSGLYNRLVSPGKGRAGLPLRDVWTTLGKSGFDGGTSHGFSGKPQERIDWILATPDIAPHSITLAKREEDGRFPSDHFPVVTELELPRSLDFR